jgi:3-oxoacyl-[acyl-carrier protein] reductase
MLLLDKRAVVYGGGDAIGGARTGTLLGRFSTLVEVADVAAFVASDRASAMTGAIANLTCGSLVD